MAYEQQRNEMESESENLKFKQKCKDLKRRIGEIDENNEVITIAISRTKLAIKRLRMEYAILLERLERKTLANHNVSTVSSQTSNDYSHISSPELPSLKLYELNPTSNRRKNGGTKVKVKAKERDPKLPKRPTNSYLIFCELEKDKIKQRLDASSPPGYLYDMSKALTEAWKNLNEEDKKPYYKLYEEEKERYAKELKSYNDQKSKEAGLDKVSSNSDDVDKIIDDNGKVIDDSGKVIDDSGKVIDDNGKVIDNSEKIIDNPDNINNPDKITNNIDQIAPINTDDTDNVLDNAKQYKKHNLSDLLDDDGQSKKLKTHNHLESTNQDENDVKEEINNDSKQDELETTVKPIGSVETGPVPDE